MKLPNSHQIYIVKVSKNETENLAVSEESRVILLSLSFIHTFSEATCTRTDSSRLFCNKNVS